MYLDLSFTQHRLASELSVQVGSGLASSRPQAIIRTNIYQDVWHHIGSTASTMSWPNQNKKVTYREGIFSQIKFCLPQQNKENQNHGHISWDLFRGSIKHLQVFFMFWPHSKNTPSPWPLTGRDMLLNLRQLLRVASLLELISKQLNDDDRAQDLLWLRD